MSSDGILTGWKGRSVMHRPRMVALGLLLCAVVGGASDVPRKGATVSSEDPAVAEEPTGLVFRLSEGSGL